MSGILYKICLPCAMQQVTLWLSRPVVRHIMVWLVIVLVVWYAQKGFADTLSEGLQVLPQVILGLLPLAAGIYLNHYLLIPHLLNEKKTVWYFLGLAGIITLVALIDFYNPHFAYSTSFFWVVWMLHALMILAAMSIFLSRKFTFQQQREYEMLLKQSEMEMRLLRSQMNPHFLFNALNSIYSYAIEKSDRTAELIIQLSQLTRYQLESSRQTMLPLSEELEFLQDFLSLEETRFGERCTIEFLLNGDTDRHTIPPMMLIPFVENAFKHGVATTNEDSFVNIRIDIGSDRLQMIVVNSIPTKPTRTVSSTWTGLANTRKRLQLVYPGRHYLDILRQPNQYQVTLFIHL